MMYRKHIHYIDNDSLLQVFTCYRLEEEDNWYLQSTWRNLVQVCRRWRYLMFNSRSHLDLCLLLTNDSPSTHTPHHLPPLPLVIYHSGRTKTMVRKDEDNIRLGLQQHHGHVRRVDLTAPSLSLSMWLEPMNKVFPRLEILSLLSTTIGETNLMLPGTLQAPGLTQSRITRRRPSKRIDIPLFLYHPFNNHPYTYWSLLLFSSRAAGHTAPKPPPS